MNPVPFKEANRVLGPPPGKEDVVNPLHVYSDGSQCISCWEFTDEEVSMIVKNKHMYISVFFGETQPPILPTVKSPFSNLSDCIMIIGGEEGVTVNGKRLFSKEQVDNESYLTSWGCDSPIAKWLSRKIINIATGDEIHGNALDEQFMRLFIEPLKQGESFTLLLDINRYIKDADSGNVQPAEAYIFSAQNG